MESDFAPFLGIIFIIQLHFYSFTLVSLVLHCIAS